MGKCVFKPSLADLYGCLAWRTLLTLFNRVYSCFTLIGHHIWHGDAKCIEMWYGHLVYHIMGRFSVSVEVETVANWLNSSMTRLCSFSTGVHKCEIWMTV